MERIMKKAKKNRLSIIILSTLGLIFSIINPSIDIAILIPLCWYIYVWEKEFKKEYEFKNYKYFILMGSLGLIIVIVRTLLYNIN